MKIAAIALAAASLVAAGSAAAAARATDSDYLAASRCKGLASGLGSIDTASLDAFLRTEGVSRNAYISERAAAEMSRARKQAGSPDAKARLSIELSGRCTAFLAGDKATGTN